MLCFSNSVKLEAEWIPRRENELADYYSRVMDVDDWGYLNRYLTYVLTRVGVHTVLTDLLALIMPSCQVQFKVLEPRL